MKGKIAAAFAWVKQFLIRRWRLHEVLWLIYAILSGVAGFYGNQPLEIVLMNLFVSSG